MSSALVGTIVVVSAVEVWKASLSVIEVGENWTEVRVTRDVYRSWVELPARQTSTFGTLLSTAQATYFIIDRQVDQEVDEQWLQGGAEEQAKEGRRSEGRGPGDDCWEAWRGG